MHEYKLKNYRVIDGDTIEAVIDVGFHVSIKQILRLAGINAPETRTKDKEEKQKGRIAKNWLIKRLQKADDVYVKTEKQGKYGRYLATLFDDVYDISINEEMLNNGLAKPYKT